MFKIGPTFMLAIALAAGGTSGIGRAAEGDAAIFGARESVQDAALSPDGTKVAMVQPMKGQGSAVLVSNLAADSKPTVIMIADGKPERVQSCKWASNTRLLCNVYGVVTLSIGEDSYVTRIVAMDADGGRKQVLRNQRGTGEALGYSLYGGDVIDWNPGADGHVLMVRQYVPEVTINTRLAQTKSGLGVDDIDTATLQSKHVELARDDAVEYVSDGKGKVRIMGMRAKSANGYERSAITYLYRQAGSKNWEALGALDDEGNGFNPHGVDPVLNIAYGLQRHDGRIAAYSIALDGSMKTNLLYEHPDVDVSGFVRIGRNNRIIGVSYTTDKREARYFDPVLDKLAQSLGKAVPGLPLIRFIDSSQDETKLLLWAGSDVDAGRFYLFDRIKKSLTELLLVRPALEGRTLATVSAVRYPAADGTMIPGYLTLPPGGTGKGLPAIVMPHGGPGARDEWGFDWLAQYFAAQGYAVLQPNYRGSTGYGDAWFQKNGFQGWRTAIGDVDDGGRWLVTQGIAAPGRLAIFGWSYGGYAALQSAVTEPGLFKAVVAVAPVTDLDRLKEQWRNWSNYYRVSRFVGTGPHIEQGSPARHASDIRVPVLLFHGTLDRNVDVGQSRLMDSRLRGAGADSTLVIYEGLDHYLEDSVARTDMLTKSAAFIQKALAP